MATDGLRVGALPRIHPAHSPRSTDMNASAQTDLGPAARPIGSVWFACAQIPGSTRA
ncbi:hypothetical protein D9M71_114990 [compost metagenome]